MTENHHEPRTGGGSAEAGLLSSATQLTVGDLCISTNEWNKAAAEKWLPIIVDAVNAYAANAPCAGSATTTTEEPKA